MAGLSDAEYLEVYAACFANEGFVVLSFGFVVPGHSVRDVGSGRVDICAIEEVPVHVRSVGVLVSGWQADIFVQVEGCALREVEQVTFTGSASLS